MPISALAGVTFGVAAVVLALYHVAFVAPRLRRLGALALGSAAATGAGATATERDGRIAEVEATAKRLDGLERSLDRDLHRVGFVRYNSFSDVGSDLSFTLALVNALGDGVVVTSIYSREETRTYGKAVRKFVAQQGASDEEQSAIALARTGVVVSR